MKMKSSYTAMTYILIRLMVKFGFSVPPVKGGLTRIVLVLRRTKSFVISVVDKLGFTIVKVHDNIIGFFPVLT